MDTREYATISTKQALLWAQFDELEVNKWDSPALINCVTRQQKKLFVEINKNQKKINNMILENIMSSQ